MSAHLPIHACLDSNLFLVIGGGCFSRDVPHQRKALTTFIYYSSSKKSADHIHLLFCFTQLPSDMFAGKFVSHFLFVADDVICRGLVRSCPCDLALFCKQLFCACVWWLNSGVLIICCVCSCPGVLAGIWGWRDFLFPISIDLCVFCVLCVFMPGRVSRDMGLVWFPISYFIDLCVFCVALAETKESDQFRPHFCTITYRSP